MTLSTQFNVLDPVNPDDVWEAALPLITPEGVAAEVEDDRPTYLSTRPGLMLRETKVGQGLKAWLMMHYNADGSEKPIRMELEDGGVYFEPPYFVCLDFDTAYGYLDELGGCADLHARVIFVLGHWCNERKLRFIWQDEYSGTWYSDLASLETFLTHGSEANAWFENVARPAIEATTVEAGHYA